MGRYPDFLACLETIHIAMMALAGRYFLSINDLSMGDFHAAQHVISALDKDPAFDHRFARRRIGDLAAERSIGSQGHGTVRKQSEDKTQQAAQLHT